MMIYAPRALRHFSLAAMESRAHRVEAPERPRRVEVLPSDIQPARARPPRSRTVVRLWLPTTFIFLLLAPFAFLLAPCIYVCTPPALRTPPFATALAFGRVLLSLSGTVVHVDTPEALVSIRVF